MYDYQLTPAVRPEEFPHVMAQQQLQNWSPEQVFQRTNDQGDVLYDIVFKKASKDTSYGQMLVNRAYGKLKEVREALAPIVGENTPGSRAVGRVVAEIDKFLFEGSPDDM